MTKYTDEIITEHKDSALKKVFSLGDIRLYECPLTYINAESWGIIRLTYMTESTGHLYYDGGLGSQPCWLVEALEIYKAEGFREMEKNARQKP